MHSPAKCSHGVCFDDGSPSAENHRDQCKEEFDLMQEDEYDPHCPICSWLPDRPRKLCQKHLAKQAAQMANLFPCEVKLSMQPSLEYLQEPKRVIDYYKVQMAQTLIMSLEAFAEKHYTDIEKPYEFREGARKYLAWHNSKASRLYIENEIGNIYKDLITARHMYLQLMKEDELFHGPVWQVSHP